MHFEGTVIQNDGVNLKREHELRIRRISRSVKAIAPNAEIKIKLSKSAKAHEVLLWGTVDDLPVGIYSRGLSLCQALDYAAKRMANHFAKAYSLRITGKRYSMNAHSSSHSQFAMAG